MGVLQRSCWFGPLLLCLSLSLSHSQTHCTVLQACCSTFFLTPALASSRSIRTYIYKATSLPPTTACRLARQQLVPPAHDFQLAWQTVLLTEPPPQRFCNLLMTFASFAGLLVIASSQQEQRRSLLALYVTLGRCQGELHHLAALQGVRRTWWQFCCSCLQLFSCLSFFLFGVG